LNIVSSCINHAFRDLGVLGHSTATYRTSWSRELLHRAAAPPTAKELSAFDKTPEVHHRGNNTPYKALSRNSWTHVLELWLEGVSKIKNTTEVPDRNSNLVLSNKSRSLCH
jgi:hypothetical protein